MNKVPQLFKVFPKAVAEAFDQRAFTSANVVSVHISLLVLLLYGKMMHFFYSIKERLVLRAWGARAFWYLQNQAV